MTSETNLKNEDISLKDLILTIRDWIRYFLSKWYIIGTWGLLGGAAGLTYAILDKPVYTATTSFVLEEGGISGGLGAYAGLANAFGLGVGNQGGLFEEDNIIELYRSRRMLAKTLLSPLQSGNNNPNKLLIDQFIDGFKGYRELWNENPALKQFRFVADNSNIKNDSQKRLQDSIISRVVNDLNKNFLNIEKKDKNLSIILVEVSSPDELFSKKFNEALVSNVNDFYLTTKTKSAEENVAILQKKVDSVQSRLSGSISKAAVVADATPNQNPTRMAQRIVPIQNSRVDAEINQNVLSTLMQNLEAGKMALLKERPLIQIVDEPILPLAKSRLGKIKGVIIGGFIAIFLVTLFLSGKKLLRDALTEVA
ncbi:lipopolysaccharide biosynthesis protein [Niabella yanshanensis]|uniref:Lipopolysaccharide biosynthesis protein n=1 Tax=Niabella yanshanensis TaxID=577386 RepID=A0ABZ0W922_9BACT|nr:lipopolysaccharide biosynthesis protein [Niabella yanshanensis]WQD39103.1 lipopolysaccharide biosynthesis protein [Niabella yanshanensis]